MGQSVGVLAVRIWRTEGGEFRARMSTKSDVGDASTPEISYYTSIRDLDAAMSVWVHGYAALTNPSEHRPR